MKVEIKKDGYVYVEGKKIVESVVKEFVKLNVVEDVDIKWMDEGNDNDMRIKAVCGVNEMEIGDTSHYVSGWRSLKIWKEGIQSYIDTVNDWYLSLPIDEEEIEFSSAILL